MPSVKNPNQASEIFFVNKANFEALTLKRLWKKIYKSNYDLGSKFVSHLYTGDGYLDTPDRVQALKDALGDDRWNAISVLQVMHHGAKDNWCPTVGVEFPYRCMKVASSEPSHYGHPHKEVKDDLSPLFEVNDKSLTVKGRLYR